MTNTKVNNPYNIDSIENDYISSSDIIKDVNHDIYGLEADFVNSKFTRLEDAVGKSAGADFDSCNAFGGRRRCNLTDDGIVTAYYGEEGFVTNGITDRALKGKPAGTHVQVMVEQPKFYYKVEPVELEDGSRANEKHTNIVRYYVSDFKHSGFETHPAFIVNGIENDKIYLAAFEGCLYDVSASSYITNDSQVADFNNDKLSSIAGVRPMSGSEQELTRANARKLAHNRGAGWEQSYLATVAATQLLMIIEYGQFNIQEVLGNGVVNKFLLPTQNHAENTGATKELGNKSGEIIQGSNDLPDKSYNHISYRGEENFYGNIDTYIDGINQNNGIIYISDHNFKDDTSEAPYVSAGYCLTSSDDDIAKFEYNDSYPWLFIPGAIGGNSSLPIGDYYEYNSGWCTANLGGRWSDGSSCGPFCWDLDNASSHYFLDIGARLVYIPIVKPEASFKYHFINTEDLMIQPDINDLPKDFDLSDNIDILASAIEIEDGYLLTYNLSRSSDNKLPILKYFKIYIEVERLYQDKIIIERFDPPDKFYGVFSKSYHAEPGGDDNDDPQPLPVELDIDLFFVKQNHYHTTVNIYYYPDDNIHNIDLNALNGCIITATPDSGRYGDLIKYSVETNEETDLGDGTIYVDFIRNDDGYIISSLIEKSSSLNSDFIMQPYDITIMASTENTEIHPGKSR